MPLISATGSMHDIDFLPDEYRQQHARRLVQPWRIVVVAAFVALLAVAALVQGRQRNSARENLAVILPRYDEAVRRSARLSDLQSQLLAARSEAELYTYLRHPWPRTQILAAVTRSLPGEVTLSQLQIQREAPAKPPATEPAPRGDNKADEDKAKNVPAAQRDLKRLRADLDRSQTVVRIVGTTTDTAALHGYLAGLGKDELFTRTELRSVETAGPQDDAALKFQAVLTIRPGYGQPGGPTVAEKKN